MGAWGEAVETRTNGDYERIYGSKGKGGGSDDEEGCEEGEMGEEGDGMDENLFGAGGDASKAMVSNTVPPYLCQIRDRVLVRPATSVTLATVD